MFAAAMAGAPVVNMTSAYGGIRWGSGVARRVPVRDGRRAASAESIWECPMRYIENSPLFWLDKVKTPLLIMHNDIGRRGAVVPGHRDVRRRCAGSGRRCT